MTFQSIKIHGQSEVQFNTNFPQRGKLYTEEEISTSTVVLSGMDIVYLQVMKIIQSRPELGRWTPICMEDVLERAPFFNVQDLIKKRLQPTTLHKSKTILQQGF
uniref:Uncharacterized protein n=1 Tax=Romanomermis culicivorax TaxID=13658 RepID=A0A915ICF6_ROMCU